MTSFSEFLKKTVAGNEIAAAASEIVSFTNKNGKKFAYPIDDLQQCLQALWISSDAVQKLLSGDWKYEESKFRQAFGAAFMHEGANTVASNLGSQTPNTVRCLELYAYYKLDKTPPAKLEKPDVLSGEKLDALFYGNDLGAEFQSWLKNGKQLSDKSSESYKGAVSGLLSACAGKNLLRIASPTMFEALRERIIKHSDFIERDKTGNQMYSSALKQYLEFLTHGRNKDTQDQSGIYFPLILTEFSNALGNAGFKLAE